MIISCPYCSLQGNKKNLAEILLDGSIKILRMSKITDSLERIVDFTIIQSDSFNLICGTCQNVVIYRRPITVLPQVNIMNAWGTMLTHYEKTSIIG